MTQNNDIFEQLSSGLAVVDRWPTPPPREEYIIELTDAQYRRLWSFAWRELGLVIEPVTYATRHET